MFRRFRKKYKDSDGDGLLDAYEKAIGTDPHRKDTDRDQLSDYEEVKVYHTDPLDPDTDSDGMTDGQEVMRGRNPRGPGLLREYFIPYEGNNFRPKALEPKRLVFHAVSAVAIKVAAVAFIFVFPVTAWLTPSILKNQATQIISLTNQVRENLGLSQLVESEILNQAALAKTQDMFVQQYFAHIGPDGRGVKHWLYENNYPFYVAGENLALGFNTPSEIVQAWQNSPSHNANLIDEDYTEIGVGVVSGDYQGFETVLAAQFFGKPVALAPTEPEITAETQTQPENIQTQPEFTPSQEEPEPEVLAEVEQINLETPEIIEPRDYSVVDDEVFSISIYAPEAEMVSAYISGEKIATAVVIEGLADLSVSLREGNHQIDVISSNNDQISPSRRLNITIDRSAPQVDVQKTALMMNKPDNDSVVISATAYLSHDVVEAEVDFADHVFALHKDQSETNKWTGSLVIDEKDAAKAFSPTVPATLHIRDEAGNLTSQNISWSELHPVKAAAVSQYSFIKSNQSEFVKPLFDFSSIYLQILLGIAVLAFLLNLFIHFRKQHASVIASTLGFIVFVTILTLF